MAEKSKKKISLKENPEKSPGNSKSNSKASNSKKPATKSKKVTAADKVTLGNLEEKVLSIQADRDKMRDQLLRAAAEFENYKKRRANDSERATAEAEERIVRDLLPVLDDLDLMFSNVNDGPDSTNIVEGAKMIASKLFESLEKRGLGLIDAEGQQFNPELHEALLQQPSEDVEPGTILNVHQAGFTWKGRLLRPSRVVVAAEKSEQE